MGIVPIVDIAPFARGKDGEALVAEQIRRACENVGFFLIARHGVPGATIDGCWNAARAFFDLPLDHRMAVAMPYTGNPYGYAPMRSEALSSSLGEDSPADSPGDLTESFSVGPLDRPDKPMAPEEAAFVYAGTPWPSV